MEERGGAGRATIKEDKGFVASQFTIAYHSITIIINTGLSSAMVIMMHMDSMPTVVVERCNQDPRKALGLEIASNTVQPQRMPHVLLPLYQPLSFHMQPLPLPRYYHYKLNPYYS